MSQESFDIWMFDTNPIHIYTFTALVTGNGEYQLLTFQSGSAEDWEVLRSPSLILVNMDVGSYCTRMLLKSIVDAIPNVAIVCYSSGEKGVVQVTRDISEHVTTVSYGGVLNYLQSFVEGGTHDSIRDLLTHTNEASSQLDAEPQISILSPRELDIFYLVGRGNGTAEIASIIKCSVSTVETHIKNTRGKLHLKSLVALRQVAIKYMLLNQCYASFQQEGYICTSRSQTLGTCPFSNSA